VSNYPERIRRDDLTNVNEVPARVEGDNVKTKAREFKEHNTTIVDGKPKRTTQESQLLLTKIIVGILALIVVLMLVVVLVALPKTIKLIDRADKTIQEVDDTLGEATGVIEDIKTAVNSATGVIEKIDIDGINSSIDSLNTITSAIANPFGIFK